MTLLQSWKDSFLFFQPKYFKLFVLVTVKSLIEAYKLLFKYWWWLFVLIAASTYATVYTGYYAFQYYFYAQWMHILLKHFLVFVICLTTRPSLMKKTCAYFRAYIACFGYVAAGLFMFFLSFFFIPPLYVVVAVLYELLAFFLHPFLLITNYMPVIFPIYIFFLLFFLDSDFSPKKLLFSFYRALTMSIYNYPLYFIMSFGFALLCYLIMMGTETFFAFFGDKIRIISVGIIEVSLLMPLMICTFANIYIKKLHEQFDIYFKQPK